MPFRAKQRWTRMGKEVMTTGENSVSDRVGDPEFESERKRRLK
jgi:hypothetical protein